MAAKGRLSPALARRHHVHMPHGADIVFSPAMECISDVSVHIYGFKAHLPADGKGLVQCFLYTGAKGSPIPGLPFHTVYAHHLTDMFNQPVPVFVDIVQKLSVYLILLIHIPIPQWAPCASSYSFPSTHPMPARRCSGRPPGGSPDTRPAPGIL